MARKRKTSRATASPDTAADTGRLTLASGVLTFRPPGRSEGSPWLGGATLTLSQGEAVPARLVPAEHRHRFLPPLPADEPSSPPAETENTPAPTDS